MTAHNSHQSSRHQSSGADAVKTGAVSSVVSAIRDAFRDDISGPHASELQKGRRDVVLSRTVVLIWISVFVMPSTIWTYVFFARPERLPHAIGIVSSAVVAVLLLRFLVKKGAFDTHYHLSMLLLVGCVFGPTGTAIVEITRNSSGDFFFAFFLIYFAFTALYPAAVGWVLATSLALMASWVGGRIIGGFQADQAFAESLIYLFQLTFIGVVLNRVICTLFFAERNAQAELRVARDALLAEMEVAQQIQTLMLPKEPVLSGHDVSGLMMPAEEVGGDYYDVIQTKDGRNFIAIGDVSGHGLTSGLTMMMARASLVGVLEGDPNATLHKLYNAVNSCLRHNLQRMDLNLYMTFALFEHVGGGEFHGVGAHPPPLILRNSDRSVEEVDLQGVWLGVVDNIESADIPEVVITLKPGDVLLMYTDGIVERASLENGEMFGFERLSAALSTMGETAIDEVISGLVEVLEGHSVLQDDDVTLVAARYIGGATDI